MLSSHLKKIVMRQLTFYILVILLASSCGQTTNKQDKIVNSKYSSFHLTYSFGGLGPNQFQKFYPLIDINGETLAYTIEKKTGKYSIEKPFKDTIWTKDTVTYKVKMRTASIDSLISIKKTLKDTTIFESNPCIMDGGIHFLTIVIGTDTVTYQLMNTFDRTALKIVDIINKYLPADNKIWATEQLIKDCDDCWTQKRKQWAEDNKINKK
jgi:hypothetical protein